MESSTAAAPTLLQASNAFLSYSTLVTRGLFSNRMTLKRAMDKHGFPRPYRLGERRVAWSEGEVAVWLAGRKVS